MADAWLDVFGKTIACVPFKEYSNHLERMIIDLSDAHQPEVGRIIGARMIARLVPLQRDNIKGCLLERCRALCQDSDKDVRLVVTGELLSALLKNLSAELIDCYLIHKIFELLYDQNIEVRKTMVRTFLENLQYIPKENHEVSATILAFRIV